MKIETDRMYLVPATLESLRAELKEPSGLAAIVRMDVAGSWPPELYDREPIEYTIKQLETTPEAALWSLYYFALKASQHRGELLIGCGGYKGPPSDDGTVEIGYSIVPEYRRKGLAAEATEGLVEHAFVQRARRVIAETLPELTASIAVLEKCGFRFIGDGSEAGVIRYEILRP